ncbi:MAG: hypothetical protein D6729_18240 [Deltaproteobacteria bacterium]|nr:MAG: hypothetical protein D6729_18240 [Deltaproteobacteria bacterium]
MGCKSALAWRTTCTMLPTLLQTLAMAASGLLSFGSMTLVILLLLSERGWRNAVGYVLGYVGSYGGLGLGVVLLGARVTAGAGAGPVLGGVLCGFGMLLLWLSWRNAHKPKAPTDEPPRLFTLLERITPPKALGLGALVTVLNVKNLGLFLSALSVVLLSGLPLREQLLIASVAVLVFCSAVVLPLGIVLLAPKRSTLLLARLKDTLARHRRPLGIWAPLLFGLLIASKGVGLLW